MSKKQSEKERIAILGGGMGALTTAFYLTQTPKLRERYDITVYQQGWRLGGKLTSGRNRDFSDFDDEHPYHRNEEHGLHVWFGCYHNSFRLLFDCYDEWKRSPLHPLRSWKDAFAPQNFTPIADTETPGEEDHWPVTWPYNYEVPGSEGAIANPLEVLVRSLGLVDQGTSFLLQQVIEDAEHKEQKDDGWIEALSLFNELSSQTFEAMINILHNVKKGCFPSILNKLPKAGKTWSDLLEKTFQTILRPSSVVDPSKKPLPSVLRQLHRSYLRTVLSATGDTLPFLPDVLEQLLQWFFRVCEEFVHTHPLLKRIWILLDLSVAILRGLFDLESNILGDWDLNKIDHLDFREWLLIHGLHPNHAESAPIRTLYDMTFAYIDGDFRKPDFAAGTALRVLLRIVSSYKGSVLYLPQMGFGESVILPLYKVLKERGVDFQFFHRINSLELSKKGDVVNKIKFSKQVELKEPENGYEPLQMYSSNVGTFPCWPSTPMWEQITDGHIFEEQAKSKPYNILESQWFTYPEGTGPTDGELLLGEDFDSVVLGISLGGLKTTGSRSVCGKLMEKNPRFRDCVEQIGIVPTISAQVWSNRTLRALGWKDGKPTMPANINPLSIWADMSQVIKFESFPPEWNVRSLHYLCGVFRTHLHKQPPSATDSLEMAKKEAVNMVKHWLEHYTGSIWPKAVQSDDPDAIDWAVLAGSPLGQGLLRLAEQYIRPNIDPSECCVLGFRNTTKYRLYPNESGFSNLFLAGAWTLNGYNTACVEGAVMSGKACSRALSGQSLEVIGEDFLQSSIRQKRFPKKKS